MLFLLLRGAGYIVAYDAANSQQDAEAELQRSMPQPIAVKPGASEGMDRYTEITDPAAIVAALGGFFPGLKGAAGADLRAALGAEGCEAFCRIVSKRRKYGGGDGGRISVDLDVISEPSHINYNIGEVEVRRSRLLLQRAVSDAWRWAGR